MKDHIRGPVDAVVRAGAHLPRYYLVYFLLVELLGYENLKVYEGEKHVRTEYRIDPEQAEIVRGIFRAYDSGWGLKRIARDLNSRLIPRRWQAHAGLGRGQRRSSARSSDESATGE